MYYSEISNTESTTFQILLSNEIEQLEKLSEWIQMLAERLNISSQAVFRIELILSEAITNILENAYDDNRTHPIKVELQYFNNRVAISVEDDGIAFNPLARDEIDLPDKLEDAKIGGLGIHLIRRYSDECHYQREDNKNRLDVIIYNALEEN